MADGEGERRAQRRRLQVIEESVRDGIDIPYMCIVSTLLLVLIVIRP